MKGHHSLKGEPLCAKSLHQRTQAGRLSGHRGKREKHAKITTRDETRQALDNDIDYDQTSVI